LTKFGLQDTIYTGVANYGTRLADPLGREVMPMSVFEAISLMLAFAVLIVMLMNYLDKRK